MIGLGLVAGVLTRVASVFGIALMSLLWLSAGYPGPLSALWRYFGASLDWSVVVACFVAFLVGELEARWSLASRLLGKAKYLTIVSHARLESEGLFNPGNNRLNSPREAVVLISLIFEQWDS
jgi:hypothetical protein